MRRDNQRFSMSNCFEIHRVKGLSGRFFLLRVRVIKIYSLPAIVPMELIIACFCLFDTGDKSMLIILNV